MKMKMKKKIIMIDSMIEKSYPFKEMIIMYIGILALSLLAIAMVLYTLVYIQSIGSDVRYAVEIIHLQPSLVVPVVISFIPQDWLNSKDITFFPRLAREYLSHEEVQKSFKMHGLASALLLNNLLFKISDTKNADELSYEVLEKHVKKILCELYNYKQFGYVNKEIMESNLIFNLFRSFFIKEKSVFSKHDSIRSLFELEHYHNLILLLLVFEIEKYLFYSSQKLKSLIKDRKIDEIKNTAELQSNARLLKNKILSNITAPIRSSLSANRVSLLKRIYTGFDTEYCSVDEVKNELLCATSSTYSCVFIRVKALKFDFTVSNHQNSNSKPLVSSMIESLIYLLRYLNNKQDEKIFLLINQLNSNKQLQSFTNPDFCLFKLREEVNFADFITSYQDLIGKPENYSMKNLVEQSITNTAIALDNKTAFLTSLIQECGFDLRDCRIPIKKEIYLIAHFTIADVSSWSDFESIKYNFSILRKSLISMDRSVKLHGWKVILRDTSLLTPGMLSLGALGDLYSNIGLSKISLPDHAIKQMKVFMKEDFQKFKEYAIRDAVLCLWHALVVEQSHFDFASKLSIPLTLSVLASSYLTKELVEQASPAIESEFVKESFNKSSKACYHNPVLNALYSMKSLAKVNTPAGIELSGKLHEYVDYYLGSYHGGRNESYVYGVVKGSFYDYDLPGAYSTAMSLIDYADWSKQETLGRMSDTEFMKKYGDKLIRSYTALKVEFEFPVSVLYPNLPVRLDRSAIIFPRKGLSFCTGLEILLAIRLGCEFTVLGGSFIPFLSKIEAQACRATEVLEKSDSDEIETKDVVSPELSEKIDMLRHTSEDIQSSLTDKSSLVYKINIINAIKSRYFMHRFEGSNELDLKWLEQQLSEHPLHEISESIQGIEVPKNSISDESFYSKNIFSYSVGLNNPGEESKFDVRKFVFDNSELFTEYKGTKFFKVVKILTIMRSKYPKKTYLNLLYKFIANAGIGQMARGLSQKPIYNAQINSTQTLKAGELTSPLYAGWITSFIRCTVSELMNFVADKGGDVISCTTDGFITNLQGLEKLNGYEVGVFSKVYSLARLRLSGKNELLELKHIENTGLISWSTRGQLGLEGKIRAMTGYQVTIQSQELVEKVLDVMHGDKTLPFVQFSLRSAKDIYQKGGNVTAKLQEKVLNMKHDNRRNVTELSELNEGFFAISLPHESIISCKKFRLISSLGSKRFNVFYPSGSSKSTDNKNYLSLTKRMLVRALLNHPSLFGFDNTLTRSEIVEFLAKYKIVCRKDFVTKQKSLVFVKNSLPSTTAVLKVLECIQQDHPAFDKTIFIRK